MDFMDRIGQRVLYTAGSLGTSMLARRPTLRGACLESLVFTEPETVQQEQRSFYAAGCDAVDALTFGANPMTLSAHGLAERTREINRMAAEHVNAVRDEFSSEEWPRYSMGAIGPGARLPSLGEVTVEELRDSYVEQVAGLLEGEVDVLKVETCVDLEQMRAALEAIRIAFDETSRRAPVIASVTLQASGTMMTGAEVGDAVEVIEGSGVADIIGLNCSTGPEGMVEPLRKLVRRTRLPVFAGPNAGLPVMSGTQPEYPVGPDAFAEYQRQFVQELGVAIVGGCCGTTPEHFEAAIAAIGRERPARTG
ncbi:MAG: homocysteine S-methyltransferase family protein [Dehalococcoidia bacterium]|nr:homocysteine S-methyltransferase family protein [Dehalococcoidia bacterium]